MFGLRTRHRLAKARAAYAAARAEWKAAEERQDTRRKHTAENAMRDAMRRLLMAETMQASR